MQEFIDLFLFLVLLTEIHFLQIELRSIMVISPFSEEFGLCWAFPSVFPLSLSYLLPFHSKQRSTKEEED